MLTQICILHVHSHSPHVDQILSERNGIGIAANGDGTISVATFTLFAIWNADHGTGNLSNLGNFGSSFADYAADQIIWHSHFMLLRIGLRSSLCRAQLGTGEGSESYINKTSTDLRGWMKIKKKKNEKNENKIELAKKTWKNFIRAS